MRLAGGLALAFAAASTLAGSNLKLAIAVAFVIALVVTLTPELTAWETPGYEASRAQIADAIVNLPLVAVYGRTFGVYVVPGHERIAAAGFVLLTAFWTYPAFRGSLIHPLGKVVLTVAALGAIAVPAVAFSASPGSVQHDRSRPAWGIALAAVALLPALVPHPGSSRRSRIGRLVLSLVIAVAVGAGAVHQLGTDLAPTFLKDLFTAAGVGSLDLVVAALIGVVTLLAALDAWYDGRNFSDPRWADWAKFLVVAVGAVVLPTAPLLLLAGAGVLINAALWWHISFVWWRD